MAGVEELGRWQMAQRVLGLLYPPRCPVCDGILRQGEAVYWHDCRRMRDKRDVRKLPGVHPQCLPKLPFVEGAVCMRCGRPLASETGEYCYDCAAKKHMAGFRQGKSLLLYQGAVKGMLYRFKYRGRREYASYFAAVATVMHREWLDHSEPGLIVPVPMYLPKQRRRGYNQAAVFARELSRMTGIPWSPDSVRRVRNTRPMKELDDLARRRNLQGAFRVVDRKVEGQHVLLVDDIFTTGITAEEVAASLAGAGASTVDYMSISIGKGF